MNYPKFKFYTNTLKAVKEGNDRFILGIASSTSIDRDGDRMSESALHTMKSTAEANLTIFTNHEYKVPDDLFGSCVEAIVKAKKDTTPIVVKSTDGETEIATFSPQDLQVKIKVVSDAVNAKAGQLYKAIEEGVSLGFSIGGVVRKAAKVLDEKTQQVFNLIDAIDLYEISVVSIPANPDAMNLAIAKSMVREGSDVNEITEDDKKEVEIIVKNIEERKSKEPEYTMEGVYSFLTEELQKCYDEAYPVEMSEEAKEEAEYADAQHAKALAENVLMKAGKEQKVDSTDDHTIHLRSHAWELEYLLSKEDANTSLFETHIVAHLKKLKGEMKEEASEMA